MAKVDPEPIDGIAAENPFISPPLFPENLFYLLIAQLLSNSHIHLLGKDAQNIAMIILKMCNAAETVLTEV